ncbi:MAG: cysteine desulfurase [Gemmatimonadetes bacterium]|nr:cysteine desulfurase [Gemmatimonadota bacterium]
MAAPAANRFDVARVREDFPILQRLVNGRPLVYLDNAATSQKPRTVIEALNRYYSMENANVHRGVHYLSEQATAAYERARRRVQRFLHARDSSEIIFVRGTTEAINLVANTYGRSRVRPGDEIVVSAMEHPSYIVPWQMLCEAQGGRLRVIPMNDAGDLLLDEYERLLNPRVRLVAVTHVSNALGTMNPVKEMIAVAHARGIPVLLDGAQAAPHREVDVQALDCDFYTFSGHKTFGPTGIGILYGKAALLEEMPPFQGGGDMIRSVTFERTEYAPIPAKFEAGTPSIADAIGLEAAIDYLERLDRPLMEAHEAELLRHATEALAPIPGLRMIGAAREKTGLVSFVLDGIHAHDVGTIADRDGIALRAGHHCAQPVMERFGVPATARASFAFYNTHEEIDALVAAVHRARQIFG